MYGGDAQASNPTGSLLSTQYIPQLLMSPRHPSTMYGTSRIASQNSRQRTAEATQPQPQSNSPSHHPQVGDPTPHPANTTPTRSKKTSRWEAQNKLLPLTLHPSPPTAPQHPLLSCHKTPETARTRTPLFLRTSATTASARHLLPLLLSGLPLTSMHEVQYP